MGNGLVLPEKRTTTFCLWEEGEWKRLVQDS